MKPWLNDGQLSIEVREIRNQILQHRLVMERIDKDCSAFLLVVLRHAFGASKRILAVDIHRARAAYSLATRASEGERRIDVTFNPVQPVKDHWAAIIGVDKIGIQPRRIVFIRVPTVNPEFARRL